jgi:hypothetical protein
MSDALDTVCEGSCTCGSVRYRMTQRPLFVHCCHCRWCQRETGSAFVINAMIESRSVEVMEGEVAMTHIPSASGRGQDVARCPECLVGLWSYYSGLGNKISFVRVGTLDDPELMPPDIHIFTSSKQPWVILPDDAPAVPEYYNRNDYWPEESLVRWKIQMS